MTPIDIVVILVGLALIVGLAWLFFKPQPYLSPGHPRAQQNGET